MDVVIVSDDLMNHHLRTVVTLGDRTSTSDARFGMFDA